MRLVEDVSTLVPRRESVAHFIGLSLGQPRHHTALAVVERDGEAADSIFSVRHLERFPLGSAYREVVRALKGVLNHEVLKRQPPTLLLDQTEVGAPVVEEFRATPLRMRLVTVHGGDAVSREGDVYRIPKRDLVSVIQVALQGGRLKIASSLPEAGTLVRELQSFEVKTTGAPNDTYGGGREGAHDDLVFAVALAVWQGCQRPPLFFSF